MRTLPEAHTRAVAEPLSKALQERCCPQERSTGSKEKTLAISEQKGGSNEKECFELDHIEKQAQEEIGSGCGAVVGFGDNTEQGFWV